MRAVIRVTTKIVDFELNDIILYRAITNRELLNTFNSEIDLVIIEYNKGDSLDYLKDIDKDKIVLVTNDSDIELDTYKVISPASGLKDYIKGLVNKGNVIDDYDRTIEDLKAQIATLVFEKESIQNRLSSTELDSDILQDNMAKVIELQELNNSLELQITELKENIVHIQDTIIQTHQENREFISTIEKLNNDLDIVVNKNEELDKKIDNLLQEKMITDLEVSDLRYSIECKDEDISTITNKLEDLTNIVTNIIVQYRTINENETIDVKEIVGVIEDLEESKRVYEEELRLLREHTKECDNTQSEQLNEISDLKILVSEYEEKLRGYESDLELLNSKKDLEVLSISNERDELRKHNELLENEINALKELQKNLSESIVSKDIRISELLKETSQVEMYQLRIRGLEEVEGNLTLRVKEYLKDKMELSEMIRNKEEEIVKLTNELSYHKSKSGESLKAIVKSMIANYTGRAKVIPVFGTGSYGITTIAVSLADIMKSSKVLVMDFDLISPKIDAYYRTNPTCDLFDIAQKEMRTSLGALVYRGSQYICNNLKTAIKVINTNLHYFSGIYYGLNGNRFMSIDFEVLMNTIGSMYDYIIVDCGKIGCSVYSDTLIKTMHTIAYKSIIVSLNDVFDTRSAFLRLNNIGISMQDSVWVLNMSRKSIVDKDSSRYCGTSKQLVFTRENIYGEYKLYDRVPNLRGKLGELKKIVE